MPETLSALGPAPTVVPICRLPGISSLADDYCCDYNKVSDFFSGDFRDPAAYARQAGRAGSRDLPRTRLGAVLRELNLRFGCGDQTLANIEKLVQGRAGVIVTGQQAGLFSGPLYTIYKALTAVKLAESLDRNGRGEHVPVFWLASDDHDFAEINHITILDKEDRIRAIRYLGRAPSPKSPVSKIVLTEDILENLRQLEESTRDSEFKPQILSQLGDAYKPGRTFVDAFARWMARLLKPYGLIFIDADHSGLKELGRGVFHAEIARDSPSTRAALQTSRRLIQKNYPTQIRLKEGILNLFFVEEQRRSIHFADKGFRIQGGRRILQKEELLRLLEVQPHLFSPNVLLRPLYQDALLPTVAYVAGPGEIAYFSQMKGVYQSFDLPMPIIYPRKSLTIVEKKADKAFKASGLSIEDIWRDADAEINKIIKERIPQALDKTFQTVRDRIDKDLTDIKRQTLAFEPTLEKSVDHAGKNILRQLSFLENKILKAAKQRDAVMMKQLDFVKNSLYPNRHLQERTFNITPFLIKYGFSLINRLYHAIDIDHYDHQIFRV